MCGTLKNMSMQMPQEAPADSMDEGNVYINFFGPIDFQIAQGLMTLCHQLVSQGARSLYFLFASPGGEVNTGIELYNFLKSLPVKITMHNMSAIDSIATVIFLSGDERYACPHSTFLFHGPKTTFLKQTSYGLREVKEVSSALEKDEEKIKGIITENTSITREEMEQFFVSGQSTNLGFAQNKSLISAIKLPKIEENTPFINVNVSQVIPPIPNQRIRP